MRALPPVSKRQMHDSNATPVMGPEGLIGSVSSIPSAEGPTDHVRLTLTDGTDVFIPASYLVMQADGKYFTPLSPAALSAVYTETVVPVIAEELVVSKRQVATGGLRVHKTIQEHEEVVAMSLLKDHVEIRRVIVGRDVDGPQSIRHEGEVTIIPVVEEFIVVEKRLRLKEELHITRRTNAEHTEQVVTLQEETAVVERLDAAGRVTLEEIPTQTQADAARPKTRASRRNRVIPEE